MTKAASKSDKLRDASRDVPYRAIANYTYDWETWIGPDNAVRWINPAVERITGYSAAECLAMPDYPLSIIYEKDRLAMAQHLASAERGDSGNHEEFRIRRKDGELRWGAVSWQPIEDENGAADGYRTSVRDITDTKHIETELREAYREAEKADRVIGMHEGHVLKAGAPDELVRESGKANLHDAFVSMTGSGDET